MKKILYILVSFLSISAFAKELKYPIKEIPEILKENADAIIRNYSITTKVRGKDHSTSEVIFAITIFNKKAQKLGGFFKAYDKTSSIANYSLIVYNSNGEVIKKSKNKDFIDVSAYDGFSLYSDNRLLINRNNNDKFPYTIEYRYNQKDNQTLYIPPFFPVTQFNISVEHAQFNLELTETNQVRIKTKNIPDYTDTTFTSSKLVYTWELNNFNAIEDEKYMPNSTEILPFIYVAPNDFHYEGYSGNMSSWKNFGAWSWNLIKDRDELNENTINEIRTLTSKANSDEEKIKIAYKFLQENTRYVSIQLGIGGFQPFDPNKVDETNYGDCKALTNYMRTLLKAINIESNYVIIRAGKNSEYIDTDFVAQQMNHVILNIPNKRDTIWLECTNQRQPFGFLGSFTNDRMGLEITEQGGIMVNTPIYPTNLNSQFRTFNCIINEDCELQGNFVTSYSGLQYENVNQYLYLDKDEQKEKLYKKLDISGLTINNFKFNHGGDFIPYASLDLDLIIKNYGQKNGNRLIIPINPLNINTFIPKKIKKRKYPIKTKWTGYDSDTVAFTIPKGYKPEYLPDSVNMVSPFGEYKTKILVANDTITYIRDLKLFKGEFAASEYEEFRKFFKQIAKYDADKMVLIKP